VGEIAIPLDAIAEFRVDSLMATAEEGATGGAQLNVSSPSGTNRFHGRLFEYLRNDFFDAPLPEWASNGAAQQPLRLNQFGGALGGPIVRDKTFFFLAGEAYRQNWGYPVSGDVPSQSLIATVPSTSPVYKIINGFPGAGPKRILTPWTPATDPGDPHYMDYDLLTCECTQVVNESSQCCGSTSTSRRRPRALCASAMTDRPIRSRFRLPRRTCSRRCPRRSMARWNCCISSIHAW